MASIIYDNKEITIYIALATTAYALLGYYSTFMAVNRAVENFYTEAVLNILRSVLFFLVILVFIFFKVRVVGVVVALLASTVLVFMLSMYDQMRVSEVFLSKTTIRQTYQYITRAAPFAVLNVVGPVFMEIDIIMLSWLTTYSSVGIYNAPYRIILFLYAIPFALRRALFPNLSNLIKNNKEEAEKVIKASLRLITFIAIPLASGLIIMADDIVGLLFPEEYFGSSTVLKIMAIMLVLHYLRSIYNVILFSDNKERIAVSIFLAVTILNILLDVIFIQRHDYVGAAYASLIAEAFLVVGYYFVVRKVIKINLIKIIIPFIPAATIATIGWWLLDPVPVIIQSILGGIIYILALLAMGTISTNEVNYYYQKLKTRG